MKEIVLINKNYSNFFEMSKEMYDYMLEIGYKPKKNEINFEYIYNCDCTIEQQNDNHFEKCKEILYTYTPCEYERTNPFLIKTIKKFKNNPYLYICYIPENVNFNIKYDWCENCETIFVKVN